mgnify:CR=1 FL=1
MNIIKSTMLGLAGLLTITGCETTSSRPYAPSTENVVTMKSKFSEATTVQVGTFTKDPSVSDDTTCRALGSIEVVPGKTPVEAIESALRDELFLADAYDPSSSNVITGVVNKLDFNSIGTGSWNIGMLVSSTVLPQGYQVDATYSFKTSYSAISACQNVVDAFTPAVQQLNNNVVNHPQFPALIGAN